jgi:hypothetical protein
MNCELQWHFDGVHVVHLDTCSLSIACNIHLIAGQIKCIDQAKFREVHWHVVHSLGIVYRVVVGICAHTVFVAMFQVQTACIGPPWCDGCTTE